MTEIDAQSTIGINKGVSSTVHTHGTHSEQSFSMSKGDGEGSYSKNSSFQKSWVEKVVFPRLDEALEVIALPSHGPIRVADLGCSSGPNSIHNMDHVVEKLRARFADLTSPPPDFQVSFSDLPSNDFNNLFLLLSRGVQNNYFTSGVPGSFYGRLFPRSTVHVFFSSLSVHYLSKIPDAVLTCDSPASNKGNWSLVGCNPATATACEEQASLDLRGFLDARAAELAPRGLLCFAGRAPDPHRQRDEPRDDPGHCMDLAWGELVSKGIITKEQANIINWPVYHRRIEEVLKDVERFSSAFQVRIAEVVTMSSAESPDGDNGTSDNEAVSKTVCGYLLGAFGQFFEGYLGKEVKDLFFTHCEGHIRKSGRASEWLRIAFTAPPPAYLVILIRK